MKKHFHPGIILKVLIAGIIATALLSAFSMVYYYCGIHVNNPNGATDYTWRPHELRTNMKEGIAFFVMDENGYNNIDSSKPVDILLMGSSHTEAIYVAQKNNIASKLNQMTDLYTYNIGVAGHDIYRCTDNFQNAVNVYHPSQYAVIETTNINLDQNEMDKVIKGTAEKIVSYDKGLLYYLQLIPAFKPICKQLEIIADNVITKQAPSANGETKEITEEITEEDKEAEYTMTLNNFLDKISSASKKENIQPIIVYCPEQHMNRKGELYYNTDEQKLVTFSTACRGKGIAFIDMTSAFDDLYYEENHMAHGFINTSVGQGHMNEYAQEKVASEISKYISRTN